MAATDWLWANWLSLVTEPRIHYTSFRHAEFLEESSRRSFVEDRLAQLLHDYHTFARFNRDLLGQIGYSQLAKVLTGDQRPQNATTRSGNFMEILACDLAKRFNHYDIPVLRLQYNPNPDQSMKGDDLLGFRFAGNNTERDTVLIAEAKFRSTFRNDVIEEAYNALVRGFRPYPASLEFTATILSLRGDRNKADEIRRIGRNLAFSGADAPVQKHYLLFIGTVGKPTNPFEYLENLGDKILPNLTAINVVFCDDFIEWLNRLYEKSD